MANEAVDVKQYIDADDLINNEMTFNPYEKSSLVSGTTHETLFLELSKEKQDELLASLRSLTTTLNTILQDSVMESVINTKTIALLDDQLIENTVLQDVADVNKILTSDILNKDNSSDGLNYTIPRMTQEIMGSIGQQNEIRYRKSLINKRNNEIEKNRSYIITLCQNVEGIIFILQDIVSRRP